MSIRQQDEKSDFLMRVQGEVYAVRSINVSGRTLLPHELSHVAQQGHVEIKVEARLLGSAERRASAVAVQAISGLDHEVEVIENKVGGKAVTFYGYQPTTARLPAPESSSLSSVEVARYRCSDSGAGTGLRITSAQSSIESSSM